MSIKPPFTELEKKSSIGFLRRLQPSNRIDQQITDDGACHLGFGMAAERQCDTVEC